MKQTTKDLLTLIAGAAVVYGYVILRGRGDDGGSSSEDETEPVIGSPALVAGPGASDGFASFLFEPSLAPTPAVIGDPMTGESYTPAPTSDRGRSGGGDWTGDSIVITPPPRGSTQPPPPRTEYRPAPPPPKRVTTPPPPRRAYG